MDLPNHGLPASRQRMPRDGTKTASIAGVASAIVGCRFAGKQLWGRR